MSEETGTDSEYPVGVDDAPEWFAAHSGKIALAIAAGLWNPPHDAIIIHHGDDVMEPLHVALKIGAPLSKYLIQQAYLVFNLSGLPMILQPDGQNAAFSEYALPIAIAASTHERLARHVSLSINDPRMRVIDLDKFMSSLTFHSPIYDFEEYMRRRSIEEAKVKDLVEIQRRRAAIRSTAGIR